MIQTKIICDRCKEREGKSVVFYHTRERDASGSIDCDPHGLDLCGDCVRDVLLIALAELGNVGGAKVLQLVKGTITK